MLKTTRKADDVPAHEDGSDGRVLTFPTPARSRRADCR